MSSIVRLTREKQWSPKIEEEQTAEAIAGEGATTTSNGDDGHSRVPEVEDEGDLRAPVEGPHAPVTSGAVGPVVEASDPSTAVEGSMIIGGSSEGAGGNGVGSDVGPSIGPPPRDSAKGKHSVVEKEEPTEIPTERFEFQPTAGSSGHRPISHNDFAEFVNKAVLDRLLWDNPAVVAAVLTAQEERQKAIVLAQEEERLRDEAERAKVEGEDVLREMEAAERARAEAELPRRTTVTVAKATVRAAFSATAYVPPTPHLFVLSRFKAYKPRQMDYEAELVLRDPMAHILTTWTEVYARNLLFLELENEFLYADVFSRCLSMFWKQKRAQQRDIRGHRGVSDSLALYEGLPERVRQLVDKAGIGQFVWILTPSRMITLSSLRLQRGGGTLPIPSTYC